MIFDGAFKKSASETVAVSRDQKMSLAQLVSALGLDGTKPKHLSEATYFTCLKVLSEALGKLPLKLMQTTPELGTAPRPDHHLFSVCRYRPNPYSSASSFWTSIETARNHFGNAYALIRASGRSVSLWQMASDSVDIWWDNARILADTPHIWYRWSAPNGRRYILSDDEVLHFRTWLSFDGITGLSVQDILKATIDGSLSSQQMLNRLYDNGMTGKAVVHYTGDLSDELEKTYIAGLQNYIDGKIDGAKSLIPLPYGSDIQPLNIKLADSQFSELRKYTALQIAAAFGVKPDQINDYSKSSYSSSEAQQIAFLVDTLMWILEHYEQELSYKLLSDDELSGGYAFKFNAGALLRTTTDKQIESLAKAVSGGLYMPNEARSHLDMSKRPEGDRLYFGNGSVIPLEMAGQQYTQRGSEKNE